METVTASPEIIAKRQKELAGLRRSGEGQSIRAQQLRKIITGERVSLDRALDECLAAMDENYQRNMGWE